MKGYQSRVHNKPENEGNQRIVREFENGTFFSEKLVNYQ